MGPAPSLLAPVSLRQVLGSTLPGGKTPAEVAAAGPARLPRLWCLCPPRKSLSSSDIALAASTRSSSCSDGSFSFLIDDRKGSARWQSGRPGYHRPELLGTATEFQPSAYSDSAECPSSRRRRLGSRSSSSGKLGEPLQGALPGHQFASSTLLMASFAECCSLG